MRLEPNRTNECALGQAMLALALAALGLIGFAAGLVLALGGH